jgi:hypothetical protein
MGKIFSLQVFFYDLVLESTKSEIYCKVVYKY